MDIPDKSDMREMAGNVFTAKCPECRICRWIHTITITRIDHVHMVNPKEEVKRTMRTNRTFSAMGTERTEWEERDMATRDAHKSDISLESDDMHLIYAWRSFASLLAEWRNCHECNKPNYGCKCITCHTAHNWDVAEHIVTIALNTGQTLTEVINLLTYQQKERISA